MSWFFDNISNWFDVPLDMTFPPYIAVSKDGSTVGLATIGGVYASTAFTHKKTRFVQVVKGYEEYAENIAFLPDGAIVCWTRFNELCVRRKVPDSQEWLQEDFFDSNCSITSVSNFSCLPNGGIVTIGYYDKIVRIWRKEQTTNSWVVTNTLNDNVYQLHVCEDGRILTVSPGGKLWIWAQNPRNGRWTNQDIMGSSRHVVFELACTLNGVVVARMSHRRLSVWQEDKTTGNWQKQTLHKTIQVHSCLVSHPSGGFLCNTPEGEISIWEKSRWDNKWILTECTAAAWPVSKSVYTVCFPNGDFIFTSDPMRIMRGRDIERFRPFVLLFMLASIKIR